MNQKGFTLFEAVVAMAVSSILLVLITSVFLAQNRFYDEVTHRSGMHEKVRSVSEFIATEVRGLTEDAILTATPDRLVVRAPLALGIVCARDPGPWRYVYLPLDGTALETDAVAGWGVRLPDGSWSYGARDWGDLQGTFSTDARSACLAAGGDSTEPVGNFLRIHVPPGQGGNLIMEKLHFMLYSERVLTFAGSVLEPGRRGFFSGWEGGGLTELATGMDASSGFQYSVDGGAFAAPITSAGERSLINAVRATVRADPDRGGTSGGAPYGWSTIIPLRNAN